MAELRSRTDDWLIFDTPPRSRLAGLSFLAMGLGVIVLPLVSLARGGSSSFPHGVALGVGGCTLFGALFVAAGLAIGRGDGRLTIDLIDGSYSFRRWYLLRLESFAGPPADFLRLSLDRVLVPTEDGSYAELRVNLVWKDPDRPRYTLARRSAWPAAAAWPREARQLLEEYAAILKLPAVVDSAAEGDLAEAAP